MSTIEIRNIGPVKQAEMELKRCNVFIGPQSSGKSTMAKVISHCIWIEKEVETHPFNHSNLRDYEWNFAPQLERYHSMPYLRADSYISYQSDCISVVYENGRCKIERKNKRTYDRRKVIYIPAERNLVISSNNINGDNNISSFAFDWMNARNFYDEKNGLEFLGLGVNYYQRNENGKTVNRIVSTKGDYDIRLSEASSGLQAAVPIAAVVDFYTGRFYGKDVEYKLFTPEQNIDRAKTRKYISSAKEYRQLTERGRKMYINRLTNTKQTCFVIEEPEENLYPDTQVKLLDFMVRCCCGSQDRKHSVTITTHSPYLVNYLNLLLRRYDKYKGENAAKVGQVNFDELNVFALRDGQLHDLKMKNLHYLDTNSLSEQMNAIYDEFDALEIDSVSCSDTI